VSDDDLSPSERDRIRRRDRDAEAQQRAPMRTGMGKVFKQIQDVQARKATEPEPERRRSSQPPADDRS
jgi:hypothetical protein